MKRRAFEFVALSVICCQLLSCATKQTTFASQRQANWSEITPEAMSSAVPEHEKKINAGTYFAAGHLYEQQELFQQAITQYQRALALAPNNVPALNRLGMILARLGRHGEAEQMFLRAVEAEPGSPLLRNNLGFVYIAQKRWTDAEAEFRNAIRLDADFTRAHVNLGMALAKLDRYDEALRSFLEVLPEPDAYYNLGLMLRAKHRHRDAAETFRLALDIDPKFTAAQTQLDQLEPRLRLITSLEPKTTDAKWQALAGRERESLPVEPAIVAAKPVEITASTANTNPSADRIDRNVAAQNATPEQIKPVSLSDVNPKPHGGTVTLQPVDTDPNAHCEVTRESILVIEDAEIETDLATAFAIHYAPMMMEKPAAPAPEQLPTREDAIAETTSTSKPAPEPAPEEPTTPNEVADKPDTPRDDMIAMNANELLLDTPCEDSMGTLVEFAVVHESIKPDVAIGNTATATASAPTVYPTPYVPELQWQALTGTGTDMNTDMDTDIAKPVAAEPQAKLTPLMFDRPDTTISLDTLFGDNVWHFLACAEMDDPFSGFEMGMGMGMGIGTLDGDELTTTSIAANLLTDSWLGNDASSADPSRDIAFLTLDEPMSDANDVPNPISETEPHTNACEYAVLSPELLPVDSDPMFFAVPFGYRHMSMP